MPIFIATTRLVLLHMRIPYLTLDDQVQLCRLQAAQVTKTAACVEAGACASPLCEVLRPVPLRKPACVQV